MRHLKFTWKGRSNRFRSLITNGSAFQFDMDDVARMRDEIASLNGKLSRIYLDLMKKEKANKLEDTATERLATSSSDEELMSQTV